MKEFKCCSSHFSQPARLSSSFGPGRFLWITWGHNADYFFTGLPDFPGSMFLSVIAAMLAKNPCFRRHRKIAASLPPDPSSSDF
jgi:hypothetical protein